MQRHPIAPRPDLATRAREAGFDLNGVAVQNNIAQGQTSVGAATATASLATASATSATSTWPGIGKSVGSTASTTFTFKPDAKTAGAQVKAAIAATKTMLGAKAPASAAAPSGSASA